jgi:3-phosphoshikimate 1-carboxyvinyltransferase
VEEGAGSLRIEPAAPRGATIETYDDHRIAMAFAVAGLRASGVVIADPGCVSKTFPDFFERLDWLRRPA